MFFPSNRYELIEEKEEKKRLTLKTTQQTKDYLLECIVVKPACLVWTKYNIFG